MTFLHCPFQTFLSGFIFYVRGRLMISLFVAVNLGVSAKANTFPTLCFPLTVIHHV